MIKTNIDVKVDTMDITAQKDRQSKVVIICMEAAQFVVFGPRSAD